MEKKLISIGAVVLILALILTLAPACGNGEEEKTPTPGPGRTPTPGVTPTPTGEIKTLKIGLMAPLSGPAASWGVQMEDGANWAADDFNEAGGIKVGDDRYMIEILSCDDHLMGSGVANCAQEFTSKGIRHVCGPISKVCEAALPIFDEVKAINISCTGDLDMGIQFPYNFAAGGPPNWQPNFMREFARLHPEVKSIAYISSETSTGRTSFDNAKEVCSELGIEIIKHDFFTPGITDFYPVLTKLLSANPEALSLGWAGAGDQALIMKQARELGFTGWFANYAYVQLELMEQIVGLEYMYKIATAAPDFSSDSYSPEMRELNRRYMDEGHARPGETSMPDCVVHGYSYVTFFVTAMEKAGSIDTEELMKVYDDPSFTFERYYVPNAKLGGFETYGINHFVPHYVPYAEIIDGKLVQMGGAVCAVP